MASAAVRVATVPGQMNQAAIFAYPQGAMMVATTAPAKRVGWFASDSMAGMLTPDGLRLFDAAVAWAVMP
jgi:hypothetical protein